jgi:iron complex outermembrane receptor protein
VGGLQAFAQSVQVSGTIKDPDQSVVSNAVVTLSDVQTAATLQTTTNQAGQYTFSSVLPGTYRLEAHKEGFIPIVIPSVVILAGQSTTHDLSFALAGASISVTINASSTGTPADGYYVDNVAQGTLGSSPIVNLPYTISVLPSQQIANTQARSLKDSIKYLPLVTFQEQQGSEVLRPETRGIEGANMQNTRQDGMGMAITGANAMEQYEQMEVVNGLGASFYGPANPSGMFNFVLKRPTEEHTENISMEYDSKSIGTVYGDFGGRFGPNKIFGYRSNLLYGEGGTYVADSHLRRRLAEFAFDVRPTNRTLIDVSYSVYDILQRGYPGWFTYGLNSSVTGVTPKPSLLLPAAPDPTRVGYGQSYAGVNLTTQSASARLHHDFPPVWHAMAGGLFQRIDRRIDTPVNNITDNAGDYSSSLADSFAPRFGVGSDLGYITGLIKKWNISQDVVVGSTGYDFISYSSGLLPSAASVLLGTANIQAPKIFAEPAAGLPQNKDLYESSVVHQQGFNLGDLITFSKNFLVRLAASQDWIGVDNNNSSSVRTSGSNKNGISPSASIMYKPAQSMTVYGTYASSLQQGDVAPGSAANANQALAPYRSKEWEFGYNDQIHTFELHTDLFRIQRPFANTNAQNFFEITGLQVNYGAEISVQGTLFQRLLVDGGFTALNARLNDTGIPATNGKRFVGTPSYKSAFYSEYRLPVINGLIVTGDWQFEGERPQDDENLHVTPGFSMFDFGLRYTHLVRGKSMIWRVSSNNITDTRYYSTIAPGDITGTNASSNTAHLGAPRTVQATMQIAF